MKNIIRKRQLPHAFDVKSQQSAMVNKANYDIMVKTM